MDRDLVQAAARHQWRAMGSAASIVAVGDRPAMVDHAVRRIAQLEARWSRFHPASEVSRLTLHAGRPVEVSADTVRLVRCAVEAWRLSGGLVNPTVLGALEAAGYDRPFERIDPTSSTAAHSHVGAIVACTDIVIDGSTVTLPAGTGFDPGGIGKGLAADIVTTELIDAGAAGVCVNLGGDLRVAGRAPGGDAWTVAIEDGDGWPVTHLGLTSGAVATSSTARRAWRRCGERMHHLIDPATGRPSATDLVQATAVAGHGWVAEAFAKAVLLRGSATAFDVVPDGIAALAVARDGTLLSTASLEAYR